MTFDDRPEPAKRLEQARIEAGFDSALEAATRFNWAYATYSQHERGERGITRAAKKYAKAFKVSEGWLLTGESDQRATDPTLERLRDLLPNINEAGRRALVVSAEALASQASPPVEESPADGARSAEAKRGQSS